MGWECELRPASGARGPAGGVIRGSHCSEEGMANTHSAASVSSGQQWEGLKSDACLSLILILFYVIVKPKTNVLLGTIKDTYSTLL